MNFTTVPLAEEQLKIFTVLDIVVVRVFSSPHLWYAGIIDDRVMKNDSLVIHVKTSVRFERSVQKDIWYPDTSLVKVTTDTIVLGSKDKVTQFTLSQPQLIKHHVFREGEGIIGIQHLEGFTHLSCRAPDVLSIEKMLESAT